MTMKYTTATQTARRRPIYIPDPPKPKLEDMTSSDHLAATGNMHYLILHFGNPETTIVRGERYLFTDLGVPFSERRVPDLLIAFDADLELYRANNAYIISEQGKPPDFVLEVASRHTARRDLWEKREDYRAMGVSEYWRFDETGEFYGEGLAGDLLVEVGVPAGRHRDGGRGRTARVQPRAQAEHPLGTRRTELARPCNGAAHRHIRFRTPGPLGGRARLPAIRTGPPHRRAGTPAGRAGTRIGTCGTPRRRGPRPRTGRATAPARRVATQNYLERGMALSSDTISES